MKRNRFLAGTILLCFVLLWMISAAAGSAFSFRNGVTWDTTVAGMMAAEGLSDGDGSYNRHDEYGYTFFYLKKNNVYYVFRGDQLVNAYSLLAGGAYAEEAERLTALYGLPADISEDTVGALFSQMVPNSYFSDLTAWRLDDGTIVALYTIDGRNYLGYLNGQRIRGGA